jgi:hypothetical protein
VFDRALQEFRVMLDEDGGRILTRSTDLARGRA